MSIPPKIVTPRGKEYAVRLATEIGGPEVDAFGALDLGEREILIREGLPEPIQLETLVHEMIHLADHDCRRAGRYQQGLTEEQTEALGTAMYHMLATAGLIAGSPVG
jgi:hypothetical protein